MASYSLFIPGVTGSDPAHLVGVGLGALLRDGDSGPGFWPAEGSSPSGQPGMFCTWQRPGHTGNARTVYDPASQLWTPAKPDAEHQFPAGRYWFGVERSAPPRPEDLERTGKLLTGRALPLGDGQLWTLPNIFQLPHVYALDDAGYETRVVRQQFDTIYQRGLWAYAEAERGVRLEAGETGLAPVDEPACRRYVVEMLAHNYRLTYPIALQLGLLDDDCWFPALYATTDFMRLFALLADLKKKAGAVTPTT